MGHYCLAIDMGAFGGRHILGQLMYLDSGLSLADARAIIARSHAAEMQRYG